MSTAPASSHTWERAVEWLRSQPGYEGLVRDCYFDDPLIGAAERFLRSTEWGAVRGFLPEHPARALDLGAGRGIGSYALSREGWSVTAMEPDGSPLVGAQAILELSKTKEDIPVVRGLAEALSFRDAAFSLVYGRQVLHHAADLRVLCAEVFRVLCPGGRFIATREHVISRPSDLETFLKVHPLHRVFGGEKAYCLGEYLAALRSSGLRVRRVLGPFDSPINVWPMSYDEWWLNCVGPLKRILGARVTQALASGSHPAGRWLLRMLARWRSCRNDTPGRLYSFIAERPA